ncbi:MAG: DNA-directed RNA polymerase subunit beta' [Candidatus Falkowbacteria bacterium GW2011_GWA2_39_24]|uniref:DNA-directed RNA polymerase subunit beta' n=1 Tax=Candidatus Falkowbacteria bacterium GW2011_GWA2_39_24 TaxID=1618634 RepID=A0A0G0NFY7_9BACT|nr:MAG: DNA-directed RNA polymerase subunit beta' [Candidatus Falkowbacteria bacterium GW2011_GWA2_39_24]
MLNPIKTTDFEAIRLHVASPDDIFGWSHGEVTRPETINYRTQKPEKNGLFCEKIFGPAKDYECHCGKYKKIRHKGIICEKCGVEVTRSIVRRERMGHIKLQTPTTHIWFLRGLSSKIGLALNMSVQALEKVVYFASFVITEVNEELRDATLEQIKAEFKSKQKSLQADLQNQIKQVKAKKAQLVKAGTPELIAEETLAKEADSLTKQNNDKLKALEEAMVQAGKEIKEIKSLAVVSETAYQNLALKYGHIFTAKIGAEAVHDLLAQIDLDKEIKALDKELKDAVDSKKEKLIKRLKFFKNLQKNNIRPEWMILTIIPVIPPDLRPMVPLDGGRYATSDLNDLYRRIINRNNRLKQLIDLSAPEVICRNEKRMLQEAVDALIDNSIRHGKTVVASTGQKRTLKSLADSLKGKQGRFRQNLLGKRTDYSGRSVITVNPKLKLYQCGIPKRMALELFKPFIISKLIKMEVVHNVRSASRYIDAGHDVVWDILGEIIKDAHVLLNRAPTLHRLGIQAFKPILIEGLALQIHPLVCTAFNADFDGDQMAVHVPLTVEAREEAATLMLSSHNLLKPATGDPIVAPGQDIVWGVYYLTSEDRVVADPQTLPAFASEEDAILNYDLGRVGLRQPMKVKLSDQPGLTVTTVGKVIFNQLLPDKLRYVNKVIDKGGLRNLVKDFLYNYGEDLTVTFLDDLKEKAFAFITRSGLSWGMDDLSKFPEVEAKIKETENMAEEVISSYEEGLLTDSERYSKIIELWTKAKEEVTQICVNSLDKNGPVYSMIKSGARGSWAQLTQILGMKGLVTSPSGAIIELPVKGNFKKGFDVLEYFIATHGVRKGLSDTALRTANAGYLTRRLVDVAQDVIIREEDCGDDVGITMIAKESEIMGKSLIKRIAGRYLSADLKNEAGKVIVKKGALIDEVLVKKLSQETIAQAQVRSLMTCQSGRGVCQKCYGYDLAYNKPVKLGTAVGIIAAQSIGEPGTQLTMRTFHTGGVAGQDDITQGLPRVEEIFEARPPKRKAFMSDVTGTVQIKREERQVEGEFGEVFASDRGDKIVAITYKGEEWDRYAFNDIAKERNIKTRKKPEILVKTGDKIKRGQDLFILGEETISAINGGTAKVEDRAVSVAKPADKVREYIIPRGFGIWVKEGDQVVAGQQLTEGSLDLRRLFELRGKEETQKYIVREIQYVYSSQGQPLNDKHIEIIAKQMFSRIMIKEAGDTDLLAGEVIEKNIFDAANRKALRDKTQPSTGDLMLMGMTKASLSTNSFLSAASFQETSRVLIDAAVSGKIDRLEGLKENVIIGRPIPTGTGFIDDRTSLE